MKDNNSLLISFFSPCFLNFKVKAVLFCTEAVHGAEASLLIPTKDEESKCSTKHVQVLLYLDFL